jgi:hypothetical protein
MTDEIARSRSILFAELMKVQHREYAPMVAQLREAIELDPDFIARACVYTATGGSAIRDTVDTAIITLLQASPTFPEYREAGRCLLLGNDVYRIEPDVSGIEPFRVFRIDDFIRKSDRKVSRLMTNTMKDYLYFLENHPVRFDGVAILNRRALKNVYRHYHVRPGQRAQAILFDNNPPADSKLAVLKAIANSQDIHEQVKLVVENRIPYMVAASILPKISPAVGIALVEVMSPTEALNSRSWLERSSLLGIQEVKDAYLAKVKKATKSVASAEHRKSAAGADADVDAAISVAKETSVQQAKKIEKATLILVDRSSSMERAIEVAQQFGSRIAPMVSGDLMVVAFHDYAQEIKVTDNTLAGWQTAFRGIRPGGWTSMQAGLDLALHNGFMPEQVVIITDGGENRGNYAMSLKAYEQRTGYSVHTVIMQIRNRSGMSDLVHNLNSVGIRHDLFETDGSDYYIYDQVAAILGGPPAKTIVERILETELPRRV